MGKYKRKTKRASYSKEALRDAVREVESGRMSGYGASKTYQIPRMTIMDHVNRKRVTSTTLGRSTALSQEIEYKLATSLHTMEKYGFGLSRKEVLEMVGDYVNKNKLITPFKNGIPGKDWFLAFKERHGLSLKKPQGVEHARKKAIDPFIVYPYYDLLEKTVCDLNIEDNPSAIWNLDETSFSKDPAKTKVVGLKGHAAIREISSPGRDNTTVLLGASASGEKMPPLIIFKGKNVWDTWTSPNAYPGTSYAATNNGWMETDVFETFFKKTFVPLVKNQRPVLLIYDGHSTHIGLNIIEEARKENITILKLPPHSSHILQPLDIAVMKSFKDRWDPLLVKWQRLNVGNALPKSEFSRLIGQVWSEIDPQVLRNGFRKAGIYPVNREEIEEDKFDMLKLRHWKEFEETRHISTKKQEIPKRHVSLEEQVITKTNPKTLVTIVFNFMKKTLNLDIPQKTQNETINLKFLEEPHDNVINLEISEEPHNGPINFEILEEPNNMNQPSEMSAQDPNVSFEELLLYKLKLGDNSPKPKRRKVAPGAEVITHDDVLEMKREERNRNLKLNANKKKEKKEEQNKDLKSNAMKKKEMKKDEQNKNLSSFASVKKEKKKQEQTFTSNKKAKDDVLSLRHVSKYSSEMQTFIAKDISDLPHCLQKHECDSKKIKVISNVLVKKADSNSLKEKKENYFYKEPKPGSSGLSKIHLKRGQSSTSVSGSISLKKKKEIGTYKTPKPGSSGLSKIRLKRRHSSTSVSGSISSHSDSDIADIESDTMLIDEDEHSSKLPQVSNKENVDGNNKENQNLSYRAGDNVLVRYHRRQKWTYYVGIIEDNKIIDEELCYSIKFYKTVKKPKLTFKMTKRIDRDDVPEIQIVKKIDLIRNPGTLNAYSMSCNENAIYF